MPMRWERSSTVVADQRRPYDDDGGNRIRPVHEAEFDERLYRAP
jgi:hypothetical protein